MNNKQINSNDEPNLPFDKNERLSFGLPSQYFESFETKLNQKLEIENELNEFSVLSSIKKINTFSLPNNYFNSSKEKLELEAEFVEYKILKSLKSHLSFSNDLTYQEEFEINLLKKINYIDELKDFTVLFSIEKKNSFSYPELYFEHVSDLIKEKIHITKPSFIELLIDIIFTKKVALSFSAIAIIMLSWFLYTNHKTENLIDSNCKTLACLEKQEILNHTKTISSFDDEQLIELVNLKKLNNQLNNHKNSDSEKSKTDSFINDSNFDEIIDEL
jgi:hypothetical protein